MTLSYASAVLACSLLLSASASAFGGDPAPPALRSFEFIGCSGDLGTASDLNDLSADVWRVTGDDGVTFLVHHAATCGMTGSKPVVRGGPDALTLGYTLSSPSDAVVMCDCEYWAAFKFGADAYRVRRVKFGNMETRLRGEWP